MSKTMYKVQIGAYREKTNAERMLEKVKKVGLPGVIVKADGLMKIQCGAFAVKANAEKRLAEAKKKGFLNALIMEVPGTGSAQETKKEASSGASKPNGYKKVIDALGKYLDSKTARKDIVNDFNEYAKAAGGIRLRTTADSLCSETVIASFWRAGLISLIGKGCTGCSSLKSNAKKLGTWHSGSSGIQAGDIILFGGDTPNHTEYSLGGKKTISGQYRGGGVHYRTLGSRKIHGYIRPKYPEEKTETGIEKEASPQEEAKDAKVLFWGIRFWESDPEKYGDAECFIQYAADGKTIAHVVLVDTGMNNTDTIKKLKAKGVKKIDAIVISHDHSDHYGFLATILEKFTVGHVYFPDQTGVRKYQPEYANRISKQHAKCTAKKVPVTYIKVGDSFVAGSIVFKAIFQADASKLPEKENHHFINNMSMAYHVTVNGKWIFHLAGDMQKDAIKQMLEAVPKAGLKCDVFKIQWHGDREAITTPLAEAMKASVAMSNYHGKRSSGGRSSTYKVLEDAGTLVMCNYEDGEVCMLMEGNTMTVSGSITGKRKTFTKAAPTAVPTATPGKWSSYKVSLTTKVKPEDVTAGMLLAIEPEDYTKSEIAALRAKGAYLLGYLSAGSVSDKRSYYSRLKPYTLDMLEDWPHEKYLDLREAAARDWCIARAKEIKAQGFDGWWIDNLDVYEEYRSDAMFTAVSSVLAGIKAIGGYIMVNGGMVYLKKAMDKDSGHKGLGNVDGVTQEEVFSRITDYSGKGKFGKQETKQSEEYQSHLKRVIRHNMEAGVLEYAEDNTLKLRIKAFCADTGVLMCISGDVNL